MTANKETDQLPFRRCLDTWPMEVGVEDGTANLIEWALGMEPDLPDVAPVGLVHDGQQWTFIYQRPANRPEGAYVVEVSSTLTGDWSDSGVVQERTAGGEVETWRAVATSSDTRLLFRLKVRQP